MVDATLKILIAAGLGAIVGLYVAACISAGVAFQRMRADAKVQGTRYTDRLGWTWEKRGSRAVLISTAEGTPVTGVSADWATLSLTSGPMVALGAERSEAHGDR